MSELQVKLLGVILSIFLIGIIFLKLPEDSLGLKTQVFGGLGSAQQFLNILIACVVLLYLAVAIQLNLSS